MTAVLVGGFGALDISPKPGSGGRSMIKLDPYTMSTGDVARVLGVTDETVRARDDELKPVRRPNGRRYYDPRIVERVANARARTVGRIPPLTTR